MTRTDREILNSLAISDVEFERQRQIQLFGIQNHSPFEWMAILMEEVGEAANAALHFTDPEDIHAFRGEIIQVAAVAIAILEDQHIEPVERGGTSLRR